MSWTVNTWAGSYFRTLKRRTNSRQYFTPGSEEIALGRVRELNAPYCILVVPLLIETDFIKLVDKVLVVDAPDSRRVGWIQQRSKLSEDEIRNIIKSQTCRRERLTVADYVIENDGTVEDLEARVVELHQRILFASGSRLPPG